MKIGVEEVVEEVMQRFARPSPVPPYQLRNRKLDGRSDRMRPLRLLGLLVGLDELEHAGSSWPTPDNDRDHRRSTR